MHSPLPPGTNRVKKGEFPCVLKHTDDIPVHKKETKSDKANYRPVSILPNLSKIYEKLIIHSCMNISTRFFHQNNVGFEKGIALNIV